MWPLWLVEMSLQHIPKNSPRLLPKPAKFEKNRLQSYKPEGLPYTNISYANSKQVLYFSLVGIEKKPQYIPEFTF